MKTIRKGIEEYLVLKQQLGFEYKKPGALLLNFATFMESRNTSVITRDLAVEFAKKPQKALPSTWASRLSVIRGFSGYWGCIDSHTETLPHRLLPCRY